jgi:hypothetical protein
MEVKRHAEVRWQVPNYHRHPAGGRRDAEKDGRGEKGEQGVKERWIVLAGLAVVAVLAGHKWWSSYQQSLGIPPRENADGTIDYTLVDPEAHINGIEKPPVRKEWVLRFPKDVYISGVEQKKVRRFEINGVSLRTDQDPNRSFSFYLNFEDFSFLGEERQSDDPDVLRVRLESEYLKYGIVAEKPGHTSYAERHFALFDRNCTKEKELAPGVFKLRQSTQEEVRRAVARISSSPEIVSRYKPELEPRCYISTDSIRISLYNLQNKPVGSGLCWERDDETIGQCNLTIWLSSNRMAGLFFKQVKIGQLQEAYEAVARMLAQATVSE